MRAGSGNLDGFSTYSTVFALEPFLDDVHVQQAEKTAAEAEAQRLRYLGLEVHRGVVQLQLGECVAQRFILIGLDRKQPGKYLRLRFLETRQRQCGRFRGKRDRVADVRVAQFLDPRDHEPHSPGRKLIARTRLRREHAHLLH